MTLSFSKLSRRAIFPAQARNAAFLQPDNWDDFGYKTLFSLTVFDEQGNKFSVGSVKIGFTGQQEGRTEERLPDHFDALSTDFFSLGQDVDYYRNVFENLSAQLAGHLLSALGDVAFDNARQTTAENEAVFSTSLMRNVSRPTIEDQFRRVLRGEAPLTNYNFIYERASSSRYSGFRLEFNVEQNSKPSSNVHVLIGRNGVGKTTLLNSMVDALFRRGEAIESGEFKGNIGWGAVTPLHENYFAGVVSVSFSAFDPFEPPQDQPDATLGMRYHYVGLKKRHQDQWFLKDKADLGADFSESLKLCLALTSKRQRWVSAVKTLESDINFAEMDLLGLIDAHDTDSTDKKVQFSKFASALLGRMSSGHSVVLLAITKLVEAVEEKTLVLFDEPESHLHPPLLSALTRALADLLVNRNAVAIIATHSPVVLQEVPKSCVSILRRTRLTSNIDRPEIETFAENVGVLTREVFGLEVTKSGFHDLLAKSASNGKSYEEIELEYRYQLGFEGKAILRSLVSGGNRSRVQDK